MTIAPSDADARFDRTIDRWFRDQLAMRPETATYLGLHDTDDQLSPGGRDAIDEEVGFYRRTIDELSAIDADELSADRALDELITQYPNADVVPSAQFFVAEAYAMEGNRAAADSVYRVVFERHPRSDRAPTAMFKLAQSYRSAGRNADARPLLERIVRDHPRSDEAALARDLLRSR